LAADNSVFPYSNANDMRATQDLNSFGEIIAHAQCSVDENKYIYILCVPLVMGIGNIFKIDDRYINIDR
jgi:hypothetical protein